MYGIEIKHRLLKHYYVRRFFRGVFPCNRLPKNLKQGIPHALIINLDPHNKPGSHWVALYISSRGKAVFFDSFGIPPLNHYIYSFIQKNSRISIHNSMVIQSLTTETCGLYCIHFIKGMCRGSTLREICQYFDPRSPQRNDRIIFHLER